MPFWSSQTIEGRLGQIVADGDVGRIKHGAYELSLGPEAFLTSDDRKRTLSPGEMIAIPPGQMALLLTEETVRLPADVIGFVSIRTKHKLRGLINVSGFHIDPGFEGRIVFAVYNAGSHAVPISRGTPVFSIWFSGFDEPVCDPYNGGHRGQSAITDDMVRAVQGTISSPASLQAQMNDVVARFERTRWFAAFIGLFCGATFSGIFVPVVQRAVALSRAGTLDVVWLIVSFGIGILTCAVAVLLIHIWRRSAPRERR